MCVCVWGGWGVSCVTLYWGVWVCGSVVCDIVFVSATD